MIRSYAHVARLRIQIDAVRWSSGEPPAELPGRFTRVGGSEASTLNRTLGTRDSARRSGVDGSSGTYVLSDHTRTKRGLQDCMPRFKLAFVPRSTGMLWLRARAAVAGVLDFWLCVLGWWRRAPRRELSSICSAGRMDGRKGAL